MYRFEYHLPDSIDPRDLHRAFVQLGVRESAYDYLPRERLWRLTLSDNDQCFRAESALKIYGIVYLIREVANRLG